MFTDEERLTITNALRLYSDIKCGKFDSIIAYTMYLSSQPIDDDFVDRMAKCKAALAKARQYAYPELGAPERSYAVDNFRVTRIAQELLEGDKFDAQH